MSNKRHVQAHWEDEVCGSRYGSLEDITERRYKAHPFLRSWAGFDSARSKNLLEIGLGTGADFSQWLANGAHAIGIDLTAASVGMTRRRLVRQALPTPLSQADCENLPFRDNLFDQVYSFGVLHHTPNTERALREVHRVLRAGGMLKAMIYHVPSWVGWLLCARHFKTPRRAIFDHLESPGTKAYRIKEAQTLLKSVGFRDPQLTIRLSPGDLMEIDPSARHEGQLFRWVRRVYPSRLVRRFGERFGLNLLVTARKT